MLRACNVNAEKKNAYRLWVGKLEKKRPLGRTRYRWVDKVRWILDRMGCYGLDLSGSGSRLVVGSLMNMVMNLQVP
jgi:hypothetical protein